MGTFSVRFALRHPRHPQQQLELEGLVGTGALFTQVPADALARIGIEPAGTRAVHYADGTRDVVPVAKADTAINGVETATLVLCGRPGSLVLLGATTLETLGLGVDPIHKKLIPIEAPMAAAQAVSGVPAQVAARARTRIIAQEGRWGRGPPRGEDSFTAR
jgi:predicted aspartyl protease